MKELRYLKNVTTLQLKTDVCIGCGRCPEVCPHAVLELQDGLAVIVDIDGCMECGACARNCPVDALQVRAGVGCAQAIWNGWLTGGEPNCDCDGGGCC